LIEKEKLNRMGWKPTVNTSRTCTEQCEVITSKLIAIRIMSISLRGIGGGDRNISLAGKVEGALEL
jgi:hypothetical protein